MLSRAFAREVREADRSTSSRSSPFSNLLSFGSLQRWHIDAALYDLSPPKVTTLYALGVPKGEPQTLRYDDGTGDELPVPLGTTAFVSGATMFDIMSPEEKSLVVRMKVRYVSCLP